MDPSDEVLHPKTMTSILESSKEQKHIGWGGLELLPEQLRILTPFRAFTVLANGSSVINQVTQTISRLSGSSISKSSQRLVLRVSLRVMSSTLFYNMAIKSVAAFVARQLLMRCASHTYTCSMGTTAALPSLPFTMSPLQELLTRRGKASMVYSTVHLPSS